MNRPRAYLFLGFGAAAGAGFGVAVDAVTSRISPEYFVLGKGVAEGPGFGWRVAEVGALAGLVAGAAVLGAALGLARWQWPFYSHPLAEGLVPRGVAERFSVVWLAHLGVYLGGALGLLSAWLSNR